ncbi:hypothetical protein [Streptacidiphilus rugosus]|uniref:hypothetical protein n=1 Tax=Streptacidiphilus rugosus TaxID=405783 RepID=UPI000AADDFB0|nr:hypothetical protein [Streptacidiphilus rugosus]
MQIPLMWRKDGDGEVMVPAPVLSELLRQIAEQLARWPEQGADRSTVDAVRVVLRRTADRIDVDSSTMAAEADTEP